MNIHEYQAKEIFKEYGLPVSEFYVSTKATGIGKAAYELAPGPFIVKCQVHSGARGKAGGVALVETPAMAEAFAAKWLGKAAKFLFASALAGVGFKIKFKDVFSKGIKPIALGGITWLCVAISSLAFIFIFSGYVG